MLGRSSILPTIFRKPNMLEDLVSLGVPPSWNSTAVKMTMFATMLASSSNKSFITTILMKIQAEKEQENTSLIIAISRNLSQPLHIF